MQCIKKNPREKISRRFKASRRRKPSRLQGVGLPGGPEEDVAVRAVIPVAVDEHATLVDVECGVVAIRERFSATAEVPLEEVFAGDAEMRCQRGRADGRGQGLKCGVQPGEETLLFISRLLVPRQPVGCRHGDAGVVVARRSLPGFPFLGEIVDDLAGRHQLSECPAAVPYDDLAVGSLGCLLLAVVGEAQDTADGLGVVDERREADGPHGHETLHRGGVGIAHGEPPLHVDSGIRQLVDAEIELLLLQSLETDTHETTPFGSLEETSIAAGSDLLGNETSSLCPKRAQSACL